MNASRASWRIAAVFILFALNYFLLNVPPAFAEDPAGGYFAYLPFMGNGALARPTPPPTSVYIDAATAFAYRSNLSSNIYVLGEVVNNSGQNVENVYLQARLYNAQGQLLDTRGVYILLPVLPNQSKTCFAIIFPNDNNRLANWTRYEFDTPTSVPVVRTPHNLTISSLYGRPDTTTKEYIVTGSIRNNETTQITCIQAVGSLYNSAGRVTGCAAAYIASLHLNAGVSSTFEIKFYGRDYSDYSGFTIQADGTP